MVGTEKGLRDLIQAVVASESFLQNQGIESVVFCPADTPEFNVREIAAHRAKVWRANGLINDRGRLVGEGLHEVAQTEGFIMCPEDATYAAYKQQIASGRVSPNESSIIETRNNHLQTRTATHQIIQREHP